MSFDLAEAPVSGGSICFTPLAQKKTKNGGRGPTAKVMAVVQIDVVDG